MWDTFDQCAEALNYGNDDYGLCGVDSRTNYCAGCVTNSGIKAKYDQRCPATTTTTTTSTTFLGPPTCKCKYEGTTLPKETWAAPNAGGTGNPLFGTYCKDWNILPGVSDHLNDKTCPKSKMCTPECNYMQLAWCYVEAGCQSHSNQLTSVETLRPHNAAYSYEFCGSANCWSISQTPTGEAIGFNNATHSNQLTSV